MRTNVRFRTNKFECSTCLEGASSGIQLADWLIEKFRQPFHIDCVEEDYYCVLFIGKPAEKKLVGACGFIEDDVWQISMHLKPSLLDKILKRPLPTQLQERFIIALDNELQSNQAFYDIEWYEENAKHQEHNHGHTAFD